MRRASRLRSGRLLPQLGSGRHLSLRCVQRHYMGDVGNVCPLVQILDLPVPRMADTVLEFFRLLGLPVAEHVIEVPKVSLSSCPSRAVLRARQVVEQLVEVPTIVRYSSLQQRSAEQVVDIPVPRGRGRRRQVFSLGRLQQRWVEQSTLTFQFREVVGHAVEVLKVYTQDRVQQRLMPSKSLTYLFLLVEVLNSLILGLQLHPHFRRMSWIKGFCTLLPG